MKHTVYLNAHEDEEFWRKCRELNLTRGELSQQIIRYYLHPKQELEKLERKKKIVEFFLIH